MAPQSFSKRNRYRQPPEISIRENAPESFRSAMLETARELDWGPSSLRDVICKTLRVRPEPSNWSEYPNIWEEVQGLVYGCRWYEAYDIVEALHDAMTRRDLRHGRGGVGDAAKFTEAINELFIDEGIGWQLQEDGQVMTRGAEAFESVVTEATIALADSKRATAASHIHDALQALSRRPNPDTAGAIYHAMGALECVARDVAGDEKATLGELLKHPQLLPPPLDSALSKVWGYASNEARHVVEGRISTREDAELVVGLAATVATYLARRNPSVVQ